MDILDIVKIGRSSIGSMSSDTIHSTNSNGSAIQNSRVHGRQVGPQHVNCIGDFLLVFCENLRFRQGRSIRSYQLSCTMLYGLHQRTATPVETRGLLGSWELYLFVGRWNASL
jgi:hypothetical protein